MIDKNRNFYIKNTLKRGGIKKIYRNYRINKGKTGSLYINYAHYQRYQGENFMNKEIIFVRIDEDLKKRLDNIALEEQRSLNNLVVRILTKFINNYEKENNVDKNLTETK